MKHYILKVMFMPHCDKDRLGIFNSGTYHEAVLLFNDCSPRDMKKVVSGRVFYVKVANLIVLSSEITPHCVGDVIDWSLKKKFIL